MVHSKIKGKVAIWIQSIRNFCKIFQNYLLMQESRRKPPLIYLWYTLSMRLATEFMKKSSKGKNVLHMVSIY